ncbi:MAG: UbiD family decarboxylase [Desulforhopalus sp.]
MSGQPDLRTFLADLEAKHPELLLTFDEEVPLDYTSTAVSVELEKRGRQAAILFNNITGHSQSLVANLCASLDLMALGVGKQGSEFRSYLSHCLDHLIPAKKVDKLPVQEIVLEGDEVDLTKLPIPVHFDGDAGPYITAGMVAAQDPDRDVGNLAYARLQVKGPRRMGMSLHSRQHLWDYHRRAAEQGKDLPAAIVIGAHPSVVIAAAAKMGRDEDEYDYAGALLGEPLNIGRAHSVNAWVPAQAEIVIEGHILGGEEETEGPFGEYTGYMTGRSTNNVFEVSAITMRKAAIFMDIIPGNSNEHLMLGRIVKEAWVHNRMAEALPFFIDFHYPNSGTHFHCHVRIEKHGEGYAKQAAELLLGLDHYVKMVIVVDKDIDPSNEREVMWAVATRMQADRDVSIINNVLCNRLDPSSSDGVGAKMIIDATRDMADSSRKVKLPPEAEILAGQLLKNV